MFDVNDLVIDGANLRLPVFVRIIIKEVVMFFDVVQFVFVNNFAYAPSLVVLRVGIFNHLVASQLPP